jgi:hypothetical protein
MSPDDPEPAKRILFEEKKSEVTKGKNTVSEGD